MIRRTPARRSDGDAPVVCVLDVGKTNVVLGVFGPDARPLEQVSRRNESRPGPPYTHLDTEALWSWLLEQLTGLGGRWPIDAIVATAHGCAPALVDDEALVLPIPDYEVEPPPDVAEAYSGIAPPYEETFAPLLPAGHNMGRHLFWLEQAFPEAFGRARYLLGYPQYWAWRLGGEPSSELTYLGAHSHLWSPISNDFSSLVERQGWRRLFPPIRPAWAEIGHIADEVARQTGLAADCRILCGIHDSNAAYLRYLLGFERAFSLVSSGTWIVVLSAAQSLEQLDGTRDVLANVDVDGQPVPSARFMGGREFERLAGRDVGVAASIADVERLLARSTLALPSYAPGGPFPNRAGQVEGPPPRSAAERVALATLYVALMTDVALDLLASRDDVIVDGGFAGSELYCALLAALRPGQSVSRNLSEEGTAGGASLLAGWSRRRVDRSASAIALDTVPMVEIEGLRGYAEHWRLRAEERGG